MDKVLDILTLVVFLGTIVRVGLAYYQHYKLDDGNDTGKDTKNPADHFRNFLQILLPFLFFISWILFMIYCRLWG